LHGGDRPGGESSRGRTVQMAKRPGGETSWGETSRGRTDEGAKRPVTHSGCGRLHTVADAVEDLKLESIDWTDAG